MPLTKATQNVVEGIVSTGSTGVSAGLFVVGQQYKITSLGTTTQSQWNTIAGTTGQTYVIGSLFTAATNGASSGNGAAAVARTLANRFADVVNVKDFGAVGDGVTDDTDNIRSARTFAEANGKSIFWPKGDYFTTGDIDRIHTIRHYGDGAIVRAGGYRFWLEPKDNQTNTLYVSPAGQDQNDAIDPTNPFKTLQKAIDSLLNYGPTLNGIWKIQLEAGTYSSARYISGLKSRQRIIFAGPNVGGHPNVPTAIIDGTGESVNNAGLYFQSGMYVQVEDIKFSNFILGDGAGLIADYCTDLYCKNVHTTGNSYNGILASNSSILRVSGGIHSNNLFYGIRIYNNSDGTIGYNGTATTNRPQIIDNSVGVAFNTGSQGHIDYCDISGGQTSIQIQDGSRTHVMGCVCGTATSENVRIDTFSTWYNNQITTPVNSYASSVKFRHSTATEYASRYFQQLDTINQKIKFGDSSASVPRVKFDFNSNGSLNYTDLNSNVKMLLDSDGNSIMAFGGNSGFESGLHFAKPGSANDGAITYSYTPKKIGFKTGNADAYYMNSTEFAPVTDNDKSLGTASKRWSQLFAGTNVINTSDEREKQQIRSLSEAEKSVAIKLKSLVKAFKFNNAVESKGEDARIHVGVIAQEVVAAFQSEGLDATQYGLLCYDEWDEQLEEKDSEGNVIQEYLPAGNRYGIRYDQLLAFIISAI